MGQQRKSKLGRKLLLASTAVVVGGYAAHRAYHSEYLRERWNRVNKYLRAASCLAEALVSASEVSLLLSRDVHAFLQSDADDLPQSVRQLLKLARSSDVQKVVACASGAVTCGVVRGLTATEPAPQYIHGEGGGSPVRVRGFRRRALRAPPKNGVAGSQWERLADGAMDKIFSEAGRGFASAVVAAAVRSLVQSCFNVAQSADGGRSDSGKKPRSRSQALSRTNTPEGKGDAGGGVDGEEDTEQGASDSGDGQWQQLLLDAACSERARLVMTECMSAFAASAVETFLERAANCRPCEEIVASITSPAHREPVKELMSAVCGNAVATLVRTSHEVWMSGGGGGGSNGGEGAIGADPSSAARRALFKDDAATPGPGWQPLPAGSLPLHPSSSLDDLNDVDAPRPMAAVASGRAAIRQGPPSCGSAASGMSPCSCCDCSPVQKKPSPLLAIEAGGGKGSLADTAGGTVSAKAAKQQYEAPALRPSSGAGAGSVPSQQSLPRSGGQLSLWTAADMAVLLERPELRQLLLEVAGAMSAQGVRALVAAVLSSLRAPVGQEEQQQLGLHAGVRGEGEEGPLGSQQVADGAPSAPAGIVPTATRIVRAVAAKAMVATSVCLALALHTLGGSKAAQPFFAL